MNEVFEVFTAIPTITVLCLLAAQLIKLFTPMDNKHLPVFCGITGLILGIICFFLIPGFLPAENVMVAAAHGIVSGWAATGANQMIKQYTKND